MCGRKPCDSPSCTWSEAWRAECEARYVMRLPKQQRQEYYRAVAEKRGEKAAHRLVADVNRLWSKATRA